MNSASEIVTPLASGSQGFPQNGTQVPRLQNVHCSSQSGEPTQSPLVHTPPVEQRSISVLSHAVPSLRGIATHAPSRHTPAVHVLSSPLQPLSPVQPGSVVVVVVSVVVVATSVVVVTWIVLVVPPTHSPLSASQV
jgi:hypothetical protein